MGRTLVLKSLLFPSLPILSAVSWAVPVWLPYNTSTLLSPPSIDMSVHVAIATWVGGWVDLLSVQDNKWAGLELEWDIE